MLQAVAWRMVKARGEMFLWRTSKRPSPLTCSGIQDAGASVTGRVCNDLGAETLAHQGAGASKMLGQQIATEAAEMAKAAASAVHFPALLRNSGMMAVVHSPAPGSFFVC